MSSSAENGSREAKDSLFTALANHRRRYVLYACNQAGGESTLSDVAEQVAAWEYRKPIEEVTSTERKRVYTSIQQYHLSKLEDAGLLEVENDRIATTETARDLDVYLEVVPEDDIPWATYYLGLAFVGIAAFALAALGWIPEPVSPLVVFGLFVAVLAGSALVHAVKSRQMKFDAADVPPEIEE
jgi:hypothetical protein